jgi:2-dehydro-3-deoxygluconokinase
MKKERIVCFGEIMLRLAPPGYERFLQSPAFMASFGGGEANVAVSLARLGFDARYVTRLPSNPLGDAALGELMRHGVDVSMVARGGERIGIYYCEKGASQRASKVVYDRKHSSIAEAKPGDIDWAAAMEGASWFHFTGITPALSEGCLSLCAEAVAIARAAGAKVSCDLNYRKNLWSKEAAKKAMVPLIRGMDLLIGNEEDAESVLGIKAEGSDLTGGVLSREGYEGVARTISERFGIPKVAITLRSSKSASDNGWAGMLLEGGACHFSKEYQVHIVDRVGGGDSFAAGLIAGILRGDAAQAALEYAVAASCLKHSIEGDFNLSSHEEIMALVGGDGSGRVRR